MDKSCVGYIPYPVFAKCMNKSIMQKEVEGPEDNFDWEYEILFKIRNWVFKEKLTVEEAFRAIDKDFDGFINKNDIQNYLKDVMKFEDKEITETRLNRLFKLMDQFKRNKVSLEDFRRFV